MEDTKVQDFIDGLATIGSVRGRLGMFACDTEAGELNTVLNEAYVLIGEYDAYFAKWKKIATALVEANYEQDAQQMSRAVEAYEEAIRNG